MKQEETKIAGASHSVRRTFRDLSDEEVADIGKASWLARYGWAGSLGWDELLQSDRILIVSEAGTGKTYECSAQQELLWKNGEAAFFLDLVTLAVSSVREMLVPDEEQRFEAWLRSQSETATFFLDSIDELKLTLGKFDQALKRLSKAIAGQLGRARIVITTRPVAVDRKLIERYLPVPLPAEARATAQLFADLMMSRQQRGDEGERLPGSWRNVGLMPLSSDQMREFAIMQGISDPDAFMADIKKRDAEEFSERPQDLIELCADWRDHRRIRTHREQVESNVVTKLRPNIDRRERTSISEEKAIDGASRLALAAMLTRKLTLKYNAGSDAVQASEVALDVSKVLLDWNADERATLLERSLFGFASYGRVRFHHRSVVEYMAAKHLQVLRRRGVPIKSIKRLLFADTAQGARTVRPSMRSVAAWLALDQHTVFDDIIAIDPAVALDCGDPQSLLISQRVRALEAYVAKYRDGGRRGLSIERIQVHRFAAPELSQSVHRLWHEGVENPEVRNLLLEIIGAGRLMGCADIAHDVATENSRPFRERSQAVITLVQLDDPRLDALATCLSSDTTEWPEAMARRLLPTLFPAYLPIPRLMQLLRRVRERREAFGELYYEFPRAIEKAALSKEYLEHLRKQLTELVLETVTWDEHKFPHVRTKRPDLVPALVAACHRQGLEGNRSASWISSTLLAIRLFGEEYGEKEALAALRKALAELPVNMREMAFWSEDAFLQGLHKSQDAWDRLIDVVHDGGLELLDSSDGKWVRSRLSDPQEPLDRREMMLWLEMTALMYRRPAAKEHLETIKPLVADAPTLVRVVEDRLKPSAAEQQMEEFASRQTTQKQQQKEKKAQAHNSWAAFWNEIQNDPEGVFATKEDDTAWNLWRAMERSGQKSRASGWNRRFIEEQFGRHVANRLREAMLPVWRRSTPTLRSERSAEQKNTFLVKWQFGLAAIAAEAEDPYWARNLSDQEAELACRYAPIELNGFPPWLEDLAEQRPLAVDRIRDQLLTKYMAADECRAGCLVVTIASNKRWKHPETGARLDFEALIRFLQEEAERLSREVGNAARLMARGLDLRPRLAPERQQRSTKSRSR